MLYPTNGIWLLTKPGCHPDFEGDTGRALIRPLHAEMPAPLV